MKSFVGLLIFSCGLAQFAASLECPACDISCCPYGFSGKIDDDGCPTCECLQCEECSEGCLLGFTDYNTEGCPDCSTCLTKPAGSCVEIECPRNYFTCKDIKRCSPTNVTDCINEARCVPKMLNHFWCSYICPIFKDPKEPFKMECDRNCKISDLTLCAHADCKENEHCELEKLHCSPNELCTPKAICVPNTCSYPLYCALECAHGLKRSENKCSDCECKIPTCKDLTCKEGFQCIEKEHCHDDEGEDCFTEAKCIPATCDHVHCHTGFICKQEDVECVSTPCTERLPKCVLETCDNIDCGNEFQCVNSTEGCSGPVCPKCVPLRDCSQMTCKPGTVCEIITPDCPECKCHEGSSPDCTPNAEGCDEDCEKPYAMCVPDCKDVECPENCKYGCSKNTHGCLTTVCALPSDCEQIECKAGEVCQVTTPDCDSDGPCADMIATCVRYCPELNCSKSHDLCPWGMMKDSNDCPTCDCNSPYSCDQVKCHVDDKCMTQDDEVVCQPCGIIDCENECSERQQRTIDEFGCLTCDCASIEICESMDCPEGQECITEKTTCDVKSSADCQPWKGKCVCIQQSCHKFCEYGFKKNPLTGCETCECNDDLPTCEDITCPKGKTCVVVPACMGTGCPLPKPVCRICPSLQLCPACQPGHEREIDDSGCETCKCKPVCSDPFCDFECGLEGRKIDENGCPTCECNPTKTCQGYQCPDDYECLEVIKKGKIVRFCKGSEKTDAIPTPI